jgi:hypothetical protein
MNLGHLFRDTVTIARSNGVNASGDQTFSAPVTCKARVEHGTKLLTTGEGNTIEAEHWYTTTTEVGQDDCVWLPGDNTGSTDAARRPIAVKKAEELLGGMTLYEVYL